MGYHGFGETPRHQRSSNKADEKICRFSCLPCRQCLLYHIGVKNLYPHLSSCGFSCFLASDRDLTGGFECFFILSVCACEPASESSASGQLIMFSTLPAVEWKQAERQDLIKPSIVESTVTPDTRKSSQPESEKDLSPSFPTDSNALSAYSPIPLSLVDNLLLHQETTQRSRRMEVVREGEESFCTYRSLKCEAGRPRIRSEREPS